MKILVVGSGGREHAIVWKLQQELGNSDKIFVARGNPGTAALDNVRNVDIPVDDIYGLLRFAYDERTVTIVGPEKPLADGIVNRFQGVGLPIFGPSEVATEIESSKVFAKQFMQRHSIPTAEPFYIADNGADVRRHASQLVKGYNGAAIKADGLAAGKGVILCRTEDDIDDAISRIYEANEFGHASNRIVVERLLKGQEASFIVWTDGEHILPLVTTQDHKAVYDGDNGPNTGGMGAYTRPNVTRGLENMILEKIIRPTVRGLSEEGRIYRGALYAGLMISDGQPYVLEFNARYGDPETQAAMRLLKSNLMDISLATINGTLDRIRPEWSDDEAVCVVLTTEGYPGKYSQNTGKLVTIKDLPDYAVIFHAGTGYKNGGLVNTGGRVLGVTTTGTDLQTALRRAYDLIPGQVYFDEMHFRRDIGQRSLSH